MRLATVSQSRRIDRLSEKDFGLTGDILMECAGSLAAREIDQSFYPELKRGMTSVICGPGNNGGDGFVVARHLHSAGHRNVVVFMLAPYENRSPLFKVQLKRAELHGLRVVDIEAEPNKLEQVRSSSLVVDALFGIGLNRNVEGEYLSVVDQINACKVPVVSLDCPSGLDCDKGTVLGGVVRSQMTLTFGLAKPGFFTADGPHHVGKLRVLPIGYAFECLRNVATSHFAFTEKLARRYLVGHKNRSHKYSHGKVLVAAGRPGMWGAGQLSSLSAYRVGAGHVTWASYDAPNGANQDSPEVLTEKLSEDLLSRLSDYQVVVIGPGLGVSDETAELIERLKKTEANVVVDADAITTCVQHDLWPLPSHWVVTPHAGELSKVINMSSREIDNDRYAAALQGAETTGCHVLLKGFRSVLAHTGRCMVINSGNSALAKAGTGDVLAGMIGGLLAQGVEPVQATATAAYIHGRMADEWVRSGHHKNSLTASDLTGHLPQLMSRLAGGALL